MSTTHLDGYPSRPKLSPSDEREVLSIGPRLEWFFPLIVLGEVRTDQPNRMPYGLVHWYRDDAGNFKSDAQFFYSVQDLRWAAEHLYRRHDEGCRCSAIFYWTPATVNYGLEFLKAAAA